MRFGARLRFMAEQMRQAEARAAEQRRQAEEAAYARRWDRRHGVQEAVRPKDHSTATAACWGEPLIVKRDEFRGDPFDRPRQVSVLGYNQHDECMVRFDRAALESLRAKRVADVQLRIVLRYGGVVVRRFTLPELDAVFGRRKRLVI